MARPKLVPGRSSSGGKAPRRSIERILYSPEFMDVTSSQHTAFYKALFKILKDLKEINASLPNAVMGILILGDPKRILIDSNFISEDCAIAYQLANQLDDQVQAFFGKDEIKRSPGQLNIYRMVVYEDTKKTSDSKSKSRKDFWKDKTKIPYQLIAPLYEGVEPNLEIESILSDLRAIHENLNACILKYGVLQHLDEAMIVSLIRLNQCTTRDKVNSNSLQTLTRSITSNRREVFEFFEAFPDDLRGFLQMTDNPGRFPYLRSFLEGDDEQQGNNDAQGGNDDDQQGDDNNQQGNDDDDQQGDDNNQQGNDGLPPDFWDHVFTTPPTPIRQNAPQRLSSDEDSDFSDSEERRRPADFDELPPTRSPSPIRGEDNESSDDSTRSISPRLW